MELIIKYSSTWSSNTGAVCEIKAMEKILTKSNQKFEKNTVFSGKKMITKDIIQIEKVSKGKITVFRFCMRKFHNSYPSSL